MKHVKAFEVSDGFETKYKKGDYIKLDTEGDTWQVYVICKVDLIQYLNVDAANTDIEYYVYTFYAKSGEPISFWTNNSEIERLATPEEIEQYNLKEYTTKYNL